MKQSHGTINEVKGKSFNLSLIKVANSAKSDSLVQYICFAVLYNIMLNSMKLC